MTEDIPKQADPTPIYFADIAGRSVRVKRPTETQAALMGRGAIRAERAQLRQDLNEALRAVGSVLDIVESLIWDQGDREFLTGLMASGELEVQEVMEALKEAIVGRGNDTPMTGTQVTRGGGN